MSPAAQGMDWQKVWLIVGLFFVGLLVFVSRKWMVGAESEAEQDRAFALRDPRRVELAAKRQSAGIWKRAERKLFGIGRLGEIKRARME